MTPLEETLTKNIDRRLAAAGASPDLNIYDNPTDPWYASLSFPFNAGCWAADFDFTCVSPYGAYFDQKAGTLVTPRHLILANHFGGVGSDSTIYFVDRAGTITPMTVDTQQARVGSTDIRVVQLTADVPSGITFAKILPSNWADYITSNGAGLPVVYLNAARTAGDYNYYLGDPSGRPTFNNKDGTDEHNSREAHVADVVNLDSSGGVYTGQPSDATRRAAYKLLYAGDSGCPYFLFARPAEPILLFCANAPDYGPGLHHYANDVNSVISNFSNNGGYQLTVADLSSFADTLYWSALRVEDLEVLTPNQVGTLEL